MIVVSAVSLTYPWPKWTDIVFLSRRDEGRRPENIRHDNRLLKAGGAEGAHLRGNTRWHVIGAGIVNPCVTI